MVFLVRPVLVGVIGSVMIVKREDFILLIIPREHIGGVAVVALGQLFENLDSSCKCDKVGG